MIIYFQIKKTEPSNKKTNKIPPTLSPHLSSEVKIPFVNDKMHIIQKNNDRRLRMKPMYGINERIVSIVTETTHIPNFNQLFKFGI